MLDSNNFLPEFRTRENDLLKKPPDPRFDGRVVWVTGASNGLGRALAGAGAELVLSARSAESPEEVATTISEHGGRVDTAPGSVSSAEDVAGAVARIEAVHGRLDAPERARDRLPLISFAPLSWTTRIRRASIGHRLGPHVAPNMP